MSILLKKLAIKKTIVYLLISLICTLGIMMDSTEKLNYAIAWVLSINIISFCIMGIDKFAAKMQSWNRIPEGTLLWISFCGGFLGFFIGRKAFNHKTTKKEFQLPMWIMFVIQMIIVAYYTLIANGLIN